MSDRPKFGHAMCCAALLLAADAAIGAAQAQGFFDLFRTDRASSFAPDAPVQESLPPPISIIPVNPNRGAVSNPATRPPAGRSGAAIVPSSTRKAPPGPQALSEEEEEDEDKDIVVDHEKPKIARIPLPPPRPGGAVRTAQEVAPVGQQRWATTTGQLPPGVNLPGITATPPQAPRLASLPQTQSIPRWTMTDEAQVRPVGLRESETPVANMPGVFAPPEATFQCLPTGLKQVLVDTAKRFGHVAVLNAKRPRGTGARGSYHYQCRAVDFRVRGVPVRTVYNFLRDHPNVGGRKIYPMGFFHVDDGPVRSW